MGVIYKITNLVNGKAYVGKTTVGKSVRWTEHKTDARHQRSNSYLHNSMRKHGIDNFSIEILADGIPDDELDALEIKWIADLKTAESQFGYNCTPGGDGAKHGPSSKCKQKGWRTLSPETREKISRANKGRKQSPETIEKVRRWLTGRKQPAEAIANRAKSLRVAFRNPETKAKLAIAAKSRITQGHKPWEFITPEAVARAEQSRKLWRETEAGMAMRQKVSKIHTGKHNSQDIKKGWETRYANPEKLDEQREKIRASKKAWWANPENRARMAATWAAKKVDAAGKAA